MLQERWERLVNCSASLGKPAQMIRPMFDDNEMIDY